MDAVLAELQAIHTVLDDLLAVERERLQGEQRMDAFINQLEEDSDQPQPEIDDDLMKRFFVKVDGRFGINEPDGTQREATPAETEFIRSHIKPAKRDR